MGREQTPNIAKIKFEVVEIKKIVLELYDRPIILEPMIKTVVHTVHVDYIWAISNLLEVLFEKTRERRKEIMI